MDPFFPYNLRDLILLLFYLVGAGVGLFAIMRGQTRVGILIIVGFLLFCLDPLAEVVVFRVMMPASNSENFDLFNWSYVCISTPAIVAGVLSLAAAFYFALPQQSSPDAPPA